MSDETVRDLYTAEFEVAVQLDRVSPIVRLAQLQGTNPRPTQAAPGTYVEALLKALTGRALLTATDEAGVSLVQQSPAVWDATFPITVPPGKIGEIVKKFASRDGGQAETLRSGSGKITWLLNSGGLFGSGSGVELAYTLTDGELIARTLRVEVRPVGKPSAADLAAADRFIPNAVRRLRADLRSAPDNRTAPRFRAARPVVFYPVELAGAVHAPFTGDCLDVSAGGLRALATASSPCRHVYAHFCDVEEVRDYAILVRLIRQTANATGFELAGSFLFAFANLK
jgi:hypothetical protein